MDDKASTPQGQVLDPTQVASPEAPIGIPQESTNDDSTDSTPQQSKVELDNQEYARLQSVERDYRESSRAGRENASQAKYWQGRAEELERRLAPPAPTIDPTVQEQLRPYLPDVTPIAQELNQLKGAIAFMAAKEQFEAEAQKYPELSEHKERLRELWVNSNLPPERVFSTFKEIVDSGNSENSRVISEKRTVRLEGARASNKTAPRQKSISEMSNKEFMELYNDPNSWVRQQANADAQRYGPQR